MVQSTFGEEAYVSVVVDGVPGAVEAVHALLPHPRVRYLADVAAWPADIQHCHY